LGDKVIEPTAEMTRQLTKYRAENDVVAAAVEDGVIGFGENYIAPKALVYEILRIFAEQTGRKALSEIKVTEKLNNLSKNTLRQVQKKLPSGRREYVWKGLGISEDALLQLKITKEVVVDGALRVVQLNMRQYYQETTGELAYPYSPILNENIVADDFVLDNHTL
jgi:hypothetical protein